MALGRRKQRARREPTFIDPVAKLDLRLTSHDRAAAGPNQSEPVFRNAGADAKQSPRKKSRPRRGRGQAPQGNVSRKAASRRGGKGRQRSSLGRLVYWTCVV